MRRCGDDDGGVRRVVVVCRNLFIFFGLDLKVGMRTVNDLLFVLI